MLPIPLAIFYSFELVKVTVTDGPVGVLRSPSLLELPKSYRFVIPGRLGINFGKVTDTVTDFLLF